jgi:hypothetical protein
MTLVNLVYSGASGASGGTISKLKGSSQTTQLASALTDVSGLDFALSANVTYEFYFRLEWTTSDVNTGISVAVNGPAFTTNGLEWDAIVPTSDTASSRFFKRAYNSAATGSTVTTSGVTYPVVLSGKVSTSAAGTLVPRFSVESGVTDSTQTITVLGSSSGWIRALSGPTVDPLIVGRPLYDDPPPSGAVSTGYVAIMLLNNDGSPALDDDGHTVYVLKKVS